MSLSVTQIKQWDPVAVREVARALFSRSQALAAAAAALGGLPQSWDGEAATAARNTVGLIRTELAAAGRSAADAAAAAARAADAIEGLQAELRRLTVDAALGGCEVDPSGRVLAAVSVGESFARRRDAVFELQARLDGIVRQADSVDTELAAALSGTSAPPPSPDRPLPADPCAFAAMWRGLSPGERDALFARDPAIGNRDGMPVGSGENPGRDHYNRRRLAEELQRARASGSENLADLQALNRTLLAHPDLRLMLLDTRGARLRAAFAAGDPDTATHVSVTTPGMNTTVADSANTMAAEAIALRQSATRQLSLAPGRAGETVATIGWIGYDAPQIRARDGLRGVVRGALGVSHDDVAGGAAGDLSRFYAGIQAARDVGPAHLTAIGHSYGSLTTGLALQQPGEHGVSEAVFYGSPGVGAETPRDLGLAPGHVYAMATPDDPIRFVFSAPAVGPVLAPVIPGPLDDVLLAAARVSGAGEFGPDPAGNPRFVQLETEAMWGLEEASGHSEYPRAGDEGERTSTYNLAAVVAGLEGNVITK